jgi:hypothetical protein
MYSDTDNDTSMTHIAVTTAVIVAVFIGLSYYRLGRVINTIIFAAVVVVALTLSRTMYKGSQKLKHINSRLTKEPFFFEASPYRKCNFNGFYGRPLQFEYSLTEPKVECNPF